MRKYVILAFGIGLTIFALQNQRVRTQSDILVGPTARVEFVGVWTRTEPGRPVQTGYLFVGPDGSERHEAGPDLQTVKLVDIKNVAEETMYTWNQGRWTGQPMQLAGQAEVPYPRQMKLPAGSVRLTHESLDVVQTTSQTGLITRRAPALNFFVVDQLLPPGSRMVLTQIQIGPAEAIAATLPAPQSGPNRTLLFEPPADAVPTITWSTKPGGIIVHKRP